MDSGMWQQVGQTIASEFSDLPDAAQVTRIVLRLTLADLPGGLLGVEREQKGKAAGVRTHMLVALGAARGDGGAGHAAGAGHPHRDTAPGQAD